jgi:hypothetical protein
MCKQVPRPLSLGSLCLSDSVFVASMMLRLAMKSWMRSPRELVLIVDDGISCSTATDVSYRDAVHIEQRHSGRYPIESSKNVPDPSFCPLPSNRRTELSPRKKSGNSQARKRSIVIAFKHDVV